MPADQKPNGKRQIGQPTTQQTGTAQKSEADALRAKLKAEGKSEQEIELWIAQADALGDLED